MKCLIVEDSPFMLEIYRFSLMGKANFEIVAEARDGVEATRLIFGIKPDLVILDLILPLKNGIDVLREMTVISPLTKTIVISSLEDEAIMVKAKALGAIQYLKKPFTKIQLLDAVDEVSRFYAEVKNG